MEQAGDSGHSKIDKDSFQRRELEILKVYTVYQLCKIEPTIKENAYNDISVR